MIDHNDGTVTDERTKLMWEQRPSPVRYTWKDATALRIASLNAGAFAGYTDWRLPTVQELAGLVDYTRRDPAINRIFALCDGRYWSSTTLTTSPFYAVLVLFTNGDVSFSFEGNSHYVQAVRAGS